MEFMPRPRFRRSVKRFQKRFASLEGDLANLLKVIGAIPLGNGSKHWDILHASSDGLVKIIKVRLSCRSLKGQDRFRVIYGYQTDRKQIDLIELYLKGEQDRESQALIDEYLGYFEAP